MAHWLSLWSCYYHHWCDIDASYPTHQSEGCAVMIYRFFLVKVLHGHNDKSKWDFICLEQHSSIGTVCPDTCTKTAVSTYSSLVYFDGRPQPFQHMHPQLWQMLYFSGCSLRIPAVLPLFKLWQKTCLGGFIVCVTEEFIDGSHS